MGRKAAFHSLGCRVNSYESEAMKELLERAGYEIVPFEIGADVYVINTCTVTNIADRKSRQMLHKAKQMNPDAAVVAVGCYVEDGRKKLEADPSVDILIGSNEKSRIAEILEQYFSGSGNGKDEDAGAAQGIRRTADRYDPLSISEAGERVRAFIKIQDGCNQFCTYCKIPYVRGRVRSRKQGEILSEAERLSEAGFQELILTGIHMSSYGMDFHKDAPQRTPDASLEKTNTDLLELVRKVCAVNGVRRVRFGSLEPGIMTEEFVAFLASEPKICPQFHLSLQSGSDPVLKRMNRRYNTEQYAKICGLLRKYFKNPAITTDIIVGFPGETEEEFRETLSFAEKTGFARIHIFKYSRRDGTPASSMPGQIPGSVKTERAEVLAEAEKKLRHSYNEQFVGKRCEVLVEEEISEGTEETILWSGHTRESVEAVISSKEDLRGRILCVTGTHLTKNEKLFCET